MIHQEAPEPIGLSKMLTLATHSGPGMAFQEPGIPKSRHAEDP